MSLLSWRTSTATLPQGPALPPVAGGPFGSGIHPSPGFRRAPCARCETAGSTATTTLLLTGRRGGLALQSDRVGRRRFGGVGGAELQPVLKVLDPLFELCKPLFVVRDQRKDRRLDLWRSLIAQGFRDRGVRAMVIELLHPSQTTIPDCKRLRFVEHHLESIITGEVSECGTHIAESSGASQSRRP